MTTRSKAFFNGLEVQVEWEMTRSHGTSPDVGRISFRQGTTLPSTFRGDLVLTNGDTEVVRFKDCILLRPQEKFSRTRDIVYQVLDWRWKWKTPVVFGQYNVRDDNNELIVVDPDIRKNPRELALILFRALHQKEINDELMTDEDFDVTALPEDVDLAPHVNWMYTPAAVELDKLCAFFACSVAPQNDGTFKIVELNKGDEPDNTNLKQPVETGLIINPAPDFVTAYAGDTWFESWLCLEPVGIDAGGEIKPIALLSYAPNDTADAKGWMSVDPKTGIGQAVRSKLRGTMSEELIDKAVDAANRSVFRMFRITGFGPQQSFFEGFTLEAPVNSPSELPEKGDPSKVYVVDTAIVVGMSPNTERRMVVWDGERYVGIATMLKPPVEDYLAAIWYDAEKIADLAQNPIADFNPSWALDVTLSVGGGRFKIIRTGGYLEDYTGDVRSLITTQKDLANPKIKFTFHGGAGFDTRLILPLLGTRVETEIDEFGKKRRKPAEICGMFFEDDSSGRNKDADSNELKVWKRGFSIDSQTGIVTLSAPAYVRGPKYPQLWLRVGYRYRITPYGSVYHRQFNKPTGSHLGVANGVVPRTDLNQYIVSSYDANYNQLHFRGTPITNTAQIDSMLDATATENIKQYQNIVAPKRKVYTPLRAINLNGKVMQVSYSGGLKSAETVVSLGTSYDITQSPAKKKAMLDAQRKQLERNMLEFTDRQNQTLNINQAPNVDNAFDASNMA